MNLPDLKALDKIIQLCRKRGVSSIKIDNVELTLGEAPMTPRAQKAAAQSLGVDGIVSDSLQGEDLLFWSSPIPGHDTETKQE